MTVVGVSSYKLSSYAHMRCDSCGMPVAAEIRKKDDRYAKSLHDLAEGPGNIDDLYWRPVRYWPTPPKPRIPEHLPAEVARAYFQAERNFDQDQMEGSSAAAYGRALDVGTKIFAGRQPEAADYEGQGLNNRIDMMRARNRITPDLAAWAHDIKEVRNDALHELSEATRADLVVLRGVTEMVLTYLFTLPEMVRRRQEEADAAKIAAGKRPPVRRQAAVRSRPTQVGAGRLSLPATTARKAKATDA